MTHLPDDPDPTVARSEARGRLDFVLSLALVGLVAGLLVTPLVAGLLGQRGGGEALQNRMLATAPEFSPATVWSRDFGKAFSAWLWDHLPLRDHLLRLDHQIDDRVFGGSPTRDAFYGPGGFSWRRERVLGGRFAGDVPPEALAAILDQVEAAFPVPGRSLHILFSPTKASIYPEHLPKAYLEEHQRLAGPGEKMLRARAASDRHLIDLWSPCLEEKERLLRLDPPLPEDRRHLWRRNDDHWSYEGGWLQGRALVQHIDPGLWDARRAPRLTDDVVMLESELSKLYLKLGITEPYRFLTPGEGGALRVERPHPGVTIMSPAATAPTGGKVLLVVRDSFFSEAGPAPTVALNGSFETVAPFFARSIFVHWNALRERDALGPLLRQERVDDVAIQVVQSNTFFFIERVDDLMWLAGQLQARHDDDGSDR
jgi:hypothetical protein